MFGDFDSELEKHGNRRTTSSLPLQWLLLKLLPRGAGYGACATEAEFGATQKREIYFGPDVRDHVRK